MDIAHDAPMATPPTHSRSARPRVLHATRTVVLAAIVTLFASFALAQPRQVSGVEGVRLLFNRKMYADCERFAYMEIWQDMYKPEAVSLLAQAIDAQRRPEDAAVWYTLLARVAAESDLPKADAAKYKAMADRRLLVLNKDWEQQRAAYAKAAAAGRKFESAEKVDDGWMTHASAGLKSLHGLYAWKTVGGRKDAKPDWVHNRQGAMHRSGMKRVDDVDGRTGVLFAVTNDKDQPTDKRPLINRIALTNVGGARFLRIGTKGYNFPYGLRVTAGDRELFNQPVGDKQWSDLKLDLGDAPAKGEQVILTLFKPEGQKWLEGAWFDYADFFAD